MFIADESTVDLGFSAARARLASMIGDGSLVNACQAAYDHGLADPSREGARCGAQGRPWLALVRCRDLVTHDGCAVVALRWEAAWPGERLFPALDADITLAPDGENTTRLQLAGAYRLQPPGSAGAGTGDAIVHMAAAATTRSLLRRLVGALAQPETSACGAWHADQRSPRRGIFPERARFSTYGPRGYPGR